MQLYNGEYSWVLWLIPVFAAVFYFAFRRKESALRIIGDSRSISKISSFSSDKWVRKAILLLIAVTFSLVAFLRPQWGAEKKKIERKGIDVMFLLDTSLSMLPQDVKPSRIEKSKIEIKSFVKKLKGDRVGLIPFAGSSFLQAPLTLDYSAFFLFLDAVSVGYIPDPGSSLTDALQNAIKAFPKGEKKYRAIVVLSDGEIHGENLGSAIKKLADENIRVYTIGMATKEGEPIPLKAERGKVVGYKKDRAGQVVVSKLDETVLRRLADETGGLYFPTTPAETEVDLIYKDMQKMGKREFKKQIVNEKEEHYQLFLLIAVCFLILENFLTDRRSESKPAANPA